MRRRHPDMTGGRIPMRVNALAPFGRLLYGQASREAPKPIARTNLPFTHHDRRNVGSRMRSACQAMLWGKRCRNRFELND